MAAFEYVALNDKGKEKKGVLEGDSAKSVRQSLRESGLTPIQINAAKSESTDKANKKDKDSFQLFQRGISSTELSLITRQFATLIQAALPLDETLMAVADQAEKQRIKSMIYAVRAKVLEGHSMATGLAEFPKIFNAKIENICIRVFASRHGDYMYI